MDKKFLSAGEILAVADLKTEELEVHEWGTWVRVRELSATDREWLNGEYAKAGDVGLHAKIAARCLVDENGARMYDDGEIAVLGAKSWPALERISKAALGLSAMGAGAVEDATKNSASDPSSASSTDSPSVSE